MIGIIRRFTWVALFLPFVCVWFCVGTVWWILKAGDTPVMALDPWMNKLYEIIVGK